MPGRPGDPFTNPQAFAYRSLIERLGDRVQALHDHDPVLVGGDVLAKYDKVKSASDAVLTDRLATAEKPFAELQRSLRALQESLLKMRGGERKADLATRRGERKANLALAGMSTTLGHLWIAYGSAAATALGMAVDGLIYPTRQSVAAVNALEYRAWLSNYLATSETVNSAVVCAMYDTVFAYPGGDNTQSGDVEAGVGGPDAEGARQLSRPGGLEDAHRHGRRDGGAALSGVAAARGAGELLPPGRRPRARRRRDNRHDHDRRPGHHAELRAVQAAHQRERR